MNNPTQVPGPKQPPRIHGDGCICGDYTLPHCPVKHRKPPVREQPASKDKLTDSALDALVENLHGYVDAGSLLHWQVTASLRELRDVRKALREAGYVGSDSVSGIRGLRLLFDAERAENEPPAELHEGTLEEPGKCDNGECWCRDRPAQPPGEVETLRKQLAEMTDAWRACCRGEVAKKLAAEGQGQPPIPGPGMHPNCTDPCPICDRMDAERYRWLRDRVLGSEYRRIGFVYSEPSDIDAQIDRILAYSSATKGASDAAP